LLAPNAPPRPVPEDSKLGSFVAVSRSEGEQLVSERREDLDDPIGGVGLRPPDPKPAVREIDVAPADLHRLPDPRAGEDEGREEGPPVADSLALAVQRCRAFEKSRDVLGPVEVGPTRLRRGNLPALPGRRVTDDEVVLDRIARRSRRESRPTC
jgi:hypothetical protein